jgi:hypothetical protein
MNAYQLNAEARQNKVPSWVRIFLAKRKSKEAPIYQSLIQGLFTALLVKLSENILVEEL